mmetsp:Transcript_19080/g.44311  ORF Transcript_19080/g.44311 Transcript_19080/m.44311 type:complete len:109 (+) Transcript_19080:814-1140(+)
MCSIKMDPRNPISAVEVDGSTSASIFESEIYALQIFLYKSVVDIKIFPGLVDINGCSRGIPTNFHRTIDDAADVATDGEDQLIRIEGTPPDVQIAIPVLLRYGKGAIP